MKIIQLLSESISLDATIKSMVADINNSIPSTFQTLETAAEKFAYNNGTLRGFPLVASGIGSRWHRDFYFNKIQKDLYDLIRYYPSQTASLRSFLSDGKRSFHETSAVLPDILLSIAQNVKSSQLERAARIWIKARSKYQDIIRSLGDSLDDEEDASTPTASQPSAIGGQNQHVEDIISHVLGSVPRKIAGEVRNIVAKSPNKLKTLKDELAKRGINI